MVRFHGNRIGGALFPTQQDAKGGGGRNGGTAAATADNSCFAVRIGQKKQKGASFDSFFDAQYRMPTILRVFLCRFFQETNKTEGRRSYFSSTIFFVSRYVLIHLVCPSARHLGGRKTGGDCSQTRHRTTAAAAPEGSALMGGDTSLPFPKEKHKKSLCLAKFGRRGPTAFLVGEKMGALLRRRRGGLSLKKPEHSSLVRGKRKCVTTIYFWVGNGGRRGRKKKVQGRSRWRSPLALKLHNFRTKRRTTKGR